MDGSSFPMRAKEADTLPSFNICPAPQGGPKMVNVPPSVTMAADHHQHAAVTRQSTAEERSMTGTPTTDFFATCESIHSSDAITVGSGSSGRLNKNGSSNANTPNSVAAGGEPMIPSMKPSGGGGGNGMSVDISRLKKNFSGTSGLDEDSQDYGGRSFSDDEEGAVFRASLSRTPRPSDAPRASISLESAGFARRKSSGSPMVHAQQRPLPVYPSLKGRGSVARSASAQVQRADSFAVRLDAYDQTHLQRKQSVGFSQDATTDSAATASDQPPTRRQSMDLTEEQAAAMGGAAKTDLYFDPMTLDCDTPTDGCGPQHHASGGLAGGGGGNALALSGIDTMQHAQFAGHATLPSSEGLLSPTQNNTSRGAGSSEEGIHNAFATLGIAGANINAPVMSPVLSGNGGGQSPSMGASMTSVPAPSPNGGYKRWIPTSDFEVFKAESAILAPIRPIISQFTCAELNTISTVHPKMTSNGSLLSPSGDACINAYLCDSVFTPKRVSIVPPIYNNAAVHPNNNNNISPNNSRHYGGCDAAKALVDSPADNALSPLRAQQRKEGEEEGDGRGKSPTHIAMDDPFEASPPSAAARMRGGSVLSPTQLGSRGSDELPTSAPRSRIVENFTFGSADPLVELVPESSTIDITSSFTAGRAGRESVATPSIAAVASGGDVSPSATPMGRSRNVSFAGAFAFARRLTPQLGSINPPDQSEQPGALNLGASVAWPTAFATPSATPESSFLSPPTHTPRPRSLSLSAVGGLFMRGRRESMAANNKATSNSNVSPREANNNNNPTTGAAPAGNSPSASPLSPSNISVTVPMTQQTTLPPLPCEDHRIVVCIHGCYGALGQWLPLWNDLSAHADVYAFDLPGFGRSERPDYTFPGPKHKSAQVAIDWFHGYFDRWFEGMRFPKKVTVIAHSFGGYLISLYAKKRPELFEHLFLADPWGVRPYDPLRDNEPLPRTVKALLWSFYTLEGGMFTLVKAAGPIGPSILPIVRPELGSSWGKSHAHGNSIYDYMYQCNIQKPTGECGFRTCAIGPACPQIPLRTQLVDEEFPKKAFKVSFLYGMKSRFNNRDAHDTYVEMKSQGVWTTYDVVPDAGHQLMSDNPADLSRFVLHHMGLVKDPARDEEAIAKYVEECVAECTKLCLKIWT